MSSFDPKPTFSHNKMLRLPPPIWALVYVLTAAAISWFFGWSKLSGLPLAPLGISLVAISWILPVWAIVHPMHSASVPDNVRFAPKATIIRPRTDCSRWRTRWDVG